MQPSPPIAAEPTPPDDGRSAAARLPTTTGRPGRVVLLTVLGAVAVSVGYTAALIAIAPRSRPRHAADPTTTAAATTEPSGTAGAVAASGPASAGPTASAGPPVAGTGPAKPKAQRPPRPGGNDDALEWVSHEDGPLEDVQMALWLASAGLSALLAWRRPGDARKVFALLLFGALVVAAREADLHEAITPGSQHRPGPLGEWGVRFRGDWWRSTTAPVLPRVLWAAVGLAVAAVTAYVLRRAAPPLLRRGGPYRPLVPLLAVAAGCYLVAYGLDDLLRYKVPLRWSQVAEETTELAGAMLYAGIVAWAARLSRAGVAATGPTSRFG